MTILVLALVRSASAQTVPVTLAASADGEIRCEVRTGPETPVVIAIGATLRPDGRALALDDPLLIASSHEPLLRGVTGKDGIFRARLPIDPRLRDRLSGVVYAQAAIILPNGGGYSGFSEIVTVPVPPLPAQPVIVLATGVLAALLSLLFLPAGLRYRFAWTLSAAALVLCPLLLARAFAGSLMNVPAEPGAASDGSGLGLALAWLPPILTAIVIVWMGHRPGFATAMALLGLVIICVPAWFAHGGPRAAAFLNSASMVVLLGTLGTTTRSRFFSVLAQACVLLAYPLVRQSWSGPGDLPFAASLLGCGVSLTPAGRRRSRTVLSAAFLATALVAAFMPDGALRLLLRAGVPDFRRLPALFWAIWESPAWLALALPGAALVLVAVLLARKLTTGSGREGAVLAAAVAAFLATETLGLLGSPGTFSVEIARNLDRILVGTLPIGAAILATVASGRRAPADQ